MIKLKRTTYRRFAFIETCLYWGMGVTARQLGEVFDIARQNAQASISAYRKEHPDNLIYNPASKRHEATEHFTPHYISREPWQYLNYLRGNSLTNHFWEDEEWSDLPIADVDALFRPYVEQKIVKTVSSAIQNKQSLYIDYHAKAGREYLTVSPNHLVYADQRYHLYAYCHEHYKWVDLVLSRILSATDSHEDWVSSDEDPDWQTYIELEFVPNPELPEPLRETLLLDFRLREGSYTIRTRKALAFYVARKMQQLDWEHNMPLWCSKPVSS